MNKLHTEANYWNLFDTGMTEWPTFQENQSAKVLIIGGGISGLLTAYQLWQYGIEFILVEGSQISEGSSLASTGFIQYSSDIMLHVLRTQIGKQDADSFYIACQEAVKNIKAIASQINQHTGDVQLYSRSSMQYSSLPADAFTLRREYEALASIGMPCELWDRHQIEQHFPFSKQIGLVTHEDAEINSHLFTLRIAQYLTKQGAKLYENSNASSIAKLTNGSYQVNINEHMIEAEYIVHAVGYQFNQLELPLSCNRNRSYVVVTEPQAKLDSWYEKMLIWESARPYLYLRTTIDNRIVIGGLDEPAHTLNTRNSEASKKYNQLVKEVQRLFPHLDLSIAYSWNAYFVETTDLLPYIGTHPRDNKQLYILGYGGNGTAYSMLGAKSVAQYISGEALPSWLSILSLNRAN